MFQWLSTHEQHRGLWKDCRFPRDRGQSCCSQWPGGSSTLRDSSEGSQFPSHYHSHRGRSIYQLGSPDRWLVLSDSCIYLYKKFIRSLKYFNLMNFNASSRDSNYYRSNSHMKPNCFGNGFIKETQFIDNQQFILLTSWTNVWQGTSCRAI